MARDSLEEVFYSMEGHCLMCQRAQAPKTCQTLHCKYLHPSNPLLSRNITRRSAQACNTTKTAVICTQEYAFCCCPLLRLKLAPHENVISAEAIDNKHNLMPSNGKRYPSAFGSRMGIKRCLSSIASTLITKVMRLKLQPE